MARKIRKTDTLPPNHAKKADSAMTIVGIGASAGGLEALEQFFSHMPANSGLAFVVIQHLDPSQPGIMPELLQRMTPMKVIQAADELFVKANQVYVIPPNRNLSLLNGALHLFEPVETKGLRLPIDVFFRSLAIDRHEKSVGIILSGMGSDGSLGLKAIKEKNGVVLVQEPSHAKFDGMPRSAMDSVIVDIVAPAHELPARLIDYLKFAPLPKGKADIDNHTKSNLDKIIILLREQSGHDFSLYKKSTLFRRIERRKGIHQIELMQNYVRYLQENPSELDILFKELLIGVTAFFRDTAVWKKLREKTLPEFIESLPVGYVIRAWVPGCSTGEEAYSLAIVLKEAVDSVKRFENITFQIFATDLDQDAIDKARKGIFSSNLSSDVSTELLNRYFTSDGENYRISTTVREMVVFAPQNVIKDPPFTKLDLIFCRNVMIYMEPELQKKLMALFNYSLKPGGILVLGTSESPGNLREEFTELDGKLKIYKRTISTALLEPKDLPSSLFHHKTETVETDTNSIFVENIQSVTDSIILQRFAPPSVLVNDKGDILYITGRTGKYLEPVAGKANWNIHAMAREGLNRELPGAFRKALQSPEPVVLPNLKMGTNGGTQVVNVTIQRLDNPKPVKGLIMVIFNDVTAHVEPDKPLPKSGKRNSSYRERELELELQRAYEELQSTREEMQTSQEELKSINEELQATNEELQSTNEELTTSKEEMQSLNEELQTVNAELQSKVNEFLRANNDMKNLLNSTEIATLFLDKELNIRRFTDQATNIIKLRTTDIGRPFTELVTDLQYPEIEVHAMQVLKTLISVETSITAKNGNWFNVRIMPYRTLDDRIDGLVITFSDISKYKILETELKEAIHLKGKGDEGS
jgi:two-component system, chemotaxis family, CheB/CheR fusion protein